MSLVFTRNRSYKKRVQVTGHCLLYNNLLGLHNVLLQYTAARREANTIRFESTTDNNALLPYKML